MELIIMMLVLLHVIGLFFVVRGLEYKREEQEERIQAVSKEG